MLQFLRPVALISLSAVALLTGCSASQQTNMTLHGTKPGAVFTQAFPVGTADVHDAGGTDIVVACHTNAATAGVSAVEQAMHIHVLWQPGYRVKADNRDVSTNATFHWYVYPAGRSDGSESPQLVEYQGTGMVEMEQAGEQIVVNVRKAALTPTTVSTKMSDPLGPTTFTGTIIAKRDRKETVARLGTLQATVAAAQVKGTSAEAKLPLGP